MLVMRRWATVLSGRGKWVSVETKRPWEVVAGSVYWAQSRRSRVRTL